MGQPASFFMEVGVMFSSSATADYFNLCSEATKPGGPCVGVLHDGQVIASAMQQKQQHQHPPWTFLTCCAHALFRLTRSSSTG